MPAPLFQKILVANRGEIAVRVMQTCRELHIPSVAVYSDADRTALHTRYATEAYGIGASPAADSYLSIERVIDAAKRSGADAIHPGYGFVSERADFARACAQEGITFIGPSPEAIQVMGDKTMARQKMIAAEVSVVPGNAEPLLGPDEAALEARALGFPVMMKAAAGGGGRGMRVAHDEAEVRAAFGSASREARAAFGDGTLYLERLIEKPRHVEVQVFGDQHGQVIHLNERECSIQRRHQKVIEESPSVVVDEALRRRMGQVAVRAAQAVDYVGAGTVEFLLDQNGDFYFLEMNTRLQVEHAVTECTTGYDLVEAQIRVAAGEKLPVVETSPQGHAIEARIYAEDPAQGFRPAPGTVTQWVCPSGAGIRVDVGVEAGAEVTPFYDPMIAKVVAWGADRPKAIARMGRALSELSVGGIASNVSFLQSIIAHPAFVSGETDISFVDQHLCEIPPLIAPELRAAFVAGAVHAVENRQTRVSSSGGSEAPSAWRRLGRQENLRGGIGR